jgi:hypothetical protein
MAQRRDATGWNVRGGADAGWDAKAGNVDAAVGEGAVWQGSGADKATAALVGVADKKADGAQLLDLRTGVEQRRVSGGAR